MISVIQPEMFRLDAAGFSHTKISMLLVVFAAATGIVYAEESPDAGGTWNTGRNVTLSSGYNYIYGGFTTSPVDMTDWWKDETIPIGNTMETFLNAAAINRNITVDTYCGSNAAVHMEHLQKNLSYCDNNTTSEEGFSIEVNALSFDNLNYTVLVYRHRSFEKHQSRINLL